MDRSVFRWAIKILAIMLYAIVLVGCTTGVVSKDADQPGGEDGDISTLGEPGAGQDAPSEPGVTEGEDTASVTPENGISISPEGESAGVGEEAGPVQPGATAPAQGPTGWVLYENPAFNFMLWRPADLVVISQPFPADIQPQPVGEALFQFAHLAESELADLNPPALTIRIYQNETGQSVPDWLLQNKFVSEGQAKDLKKEPIAGETGYLHCPAAHDATGCSLYFSHKGYIYLLAPYNGDPIAIFRTLAFRDTP
jgi:hypothetical protein